MSISHFALANSLRKAVAKRALASEPSPVTCIANGSSFRVYDNDGGILDVAVTQYKEPIR